MALHSSTEKQRRREGGEEKGSCRRDGTDLDNIWSSLFRRFGGQSTTDRIRNNYHPVFAYLAMSPACIPTQKDVDVDPVDGAILLIANTEHIAFPISACDSTNLNSSYLARRAEIYVLAFK